MLVEALLTLKKPFTILAEFPLKERTVLSIRLIAEITTGMICNHTDIAVCDVLWWGSLCGGGGGGGGYYYY